MITVKIPILSDLTPAEREWMAAYFRRDIGAMLEKQADEWGERLLEGDRPARPRGLFG